MALKISRGYSNIILQRLSIVSWLSGAVLVISIINDYLLWSWFEIRIYMQVVMAHCQASVKTFSCISLCLSIFPLNLGNFTALSCPHYRICFPIIGMFS